MSEAYTYKLYMHTMRGKHLAIGRVRHTYKLYMHTMRGKHLAIGRVRHTYMLATCTQ